MLQCAFCLSIMFVGCCGDGDLASSDSVFWDMGHKGTAALFCVQSQSSTPETEETSSVLNL